MLRVAERLLPEVLNVKGNGYEYQNGQVYDDDDPCPGLIKPLFFGVYRGIHNGIQN